MSAGHRVSNAEAMARSAAYEVGVYARQPVAFVRGQGVELWDADGKRYLDFFAGLAVNNLGHCHPAVVEAIREQTTTLLHASNVYHTLPAGELCALLCRLSFAERVFLCNSGAEANEAAMKLARRWGSQQGGGRFEILATTGSFHGRTFATLTATGQEKYHTGFLPLLPGVRLVPYGELGAMKAAVRDETVAIMVEPIQGEGGVVVPPAGYLPGLRALTERKNVLLILDEIQPGSHGTTFGGNPVACAAAVAALGALADPALLAHARTVGQHFRARLEALLGRGGITQVRGLGLMLGAVLDRPGAPVVDRCLEGGLLINCTADRVLRFLPPLVVTRAQVDEGFAVLERALA